MEKGDKKKISTTQSGLKTISSTTGQSKKPKKPTKQKQKQNVKQEVSQNVKVVISDSKPKRKYTKKPKKEIVSKGSNVVTGSVYINRIIEPAGLSKEDAGNLAVMRGLSETVKLPVSMSSSNPKTTLLKPIVQEPISVQGEIPEKKIAKARKYPVRKPKMITIAEPMESELDRALAEEIAMNKLGNMEDAYGDDNFTQPTFDIEPKPKPKRGGRVKGSKNKPKTNPVMEAVAENIGEIFNMKEPKKKKQLIIESDSEDLDEVTLKGNSATVDVDYKFKTEKQSVNFEPEEDEGTAIASFQDFQPKGKQTGMFN
jgi:hypothetical protein